MEDKQLTSQRSTSGASVTNSPGTTPSRISSISGSHAKHDIDALVEELLKVVQGLAASTPPKPLWKRILIRLKQLIAHPLLLLLTGSALTFVIGSRLTYQYTRKAQELVAERSFSDELNKLRLQKVGAVWERLDQDDVAITSLVNELVDNGGADKAARNEVLQKIQKLIDTDKGVIAQHRFWLPPETSNKMQNYLDATIFLLNRKILEPEAADIESLQKARNEAKSDVESERAKFLNPTR